MKILRALQGEGWELVDRLRLSGEQHRELLFLLRSYVIYILEREPKSIQFLSRLAPVAAARAAAPPARIAEEPAAVYPGTDTAPADP